MQARIDEWLIGENVPGDRQYVIHTCEPVFIAEIYDEDDAPVIDEIEFAMNNGQVLSRLVWYGEPVTQERAFVDLCSRAAEAIERYDEIMEAEQGG